MRWSSMPLLWLCDNVDVTVAQKAVTEKCDLRAVIPMDNSCWKCVYI